MKKVGFLAPLMMVAACDTTMAPGEEPATPGGGGSAAASTDRGVALALLPSNQGGMTAAASGILALRGRCLVLDGGGGEFVQLAFATADTSWDASAGALRVGARTFALGTRVEIGGGDFAGNGAALPWLRRPAAECGDRFWIVSSISPA